LLLFLIYFFISLSAIEWWGAGVVICLEQGADLHMARLMPLPLTVSCFSKIQIGFTFLVPAHPGSPEKRPINGCMYACISLSAIFFRSIISKSATPIFAKFAGFVWP